ncbi:hypothetical protein PanWU01x14_201570 [Parasponia andersonii]|uniref:Uncharacterized protein n=1 Tax=Parasponia andersonii TaxID=3476 RepID=A0A2P5BXY1_PARAD|nr:hypothetical protein PanWU01x14_201570 [Parasponia andersonii]
MNSGISYLKLRHFSFLLESLIVIGVGVPNFAVSPLESFFGYRGFDLLISTTHALFIELKTN